MEKTCITCFYNLGKKCKILHEKTHKNCSSWADEAEAKRREEAIKKYSDQCGNVPATRKLAIEQINQRTKVRLENIKKRGGKTVKEVLDERFMELYQQDMTDGEIGDLLGMDYARVYDYRRDKGLVASNKKNRPVGAGAAS
ncbi:hypothetical protein DSECCO2_422660 [anaerobic digester metagenome]